MKNRMNYFLLPVLLPLLINSFIIKTSQADPIDGRLFNAIKIRRYEIVSKLLEQGANPNAVDENDQTPLIYLLKKNPRRENVNAEIEISRLLIKYGADVHVQDIRSKNALHYAVRKNKLEIVLVLADNRQDLLDECIGEALAKQKFRLAKNLIGNNAYQRASNSVDGNPVILLARNGIGAERIIERNRLLSDKMDIEMADIQIDIFHLLMQKGAEINVIDQYANSPMHYAAQKYNFELMDALIKENADVTYKDSRGNLAFHYLFKKEDLNLTDRLKNVIQYFIANGVDIDAIDDYGRTVLFYANSTISKYLLENGANPNFMQAETDHNKGRYGQTPLIAALKDNDIPKIKLLLENGADPNLVAKHIPTASQKHLNLRLSGKQIPFYYAKSIESRELLLAAGGKDSRLKAIDKKRQLTFANKVRVSLARLPARILKYGPFIAILIVLFGSLLAKKIRQSPFGWPLVISSCLTLVGTLVAYIFKYKTYGIWGIPYLNQIWLLIISQLVFYTIGTYFVLKNRARTNEGRMTATKAEGWPRHIKLHQKPRLILAVMLFALLVTILSYVYYPNYQNKNSPRSQIFSFAYHDLYLKVVDQENQPVESALVKYTHGISHFSSNSIFDMQRTDQNGIIRIKIDKRPIEIQSIAKDGYQNVRPERLLDKDAKFKIGDQAYNKSNPAIMHLFKYPDNFDPKVLRNIFSICRLMNDGRDYTFDFFEGRRKKFGHKRRKGQLLIMFKKLENTSNKEWTLTLKPINGGIAPVQTFYSNLAPIDGYQQEIVLTSGSYDPDFFRNPTAFYLKTKDGQGTFKYIRFNIMRVEPYASDITGVFDIDYAINTKGGRYLDTWD